MNYLNPALFLILLVSSGVAARTESCKIYAYVIDKDPNGLNVRKDAGKNAVVVGRILPDENGVIVDVIGSRGSWLKIEKAETIDGEQAFTGSGWVFAPMLATMTRMKTRLYSAPNLKSGVLANLPGEEEVKLVACRGDWAKVEYGKKSGWLAPDAQCGNPVTTCP